MSIVAGVFDPIGLVSPIVLRGKKLLQDYCASGLGWDEPISPEKLKPFVKWLLELPSIEEWKIPRWFGMTRLGRLKESKLHFFSDASQEGYGIVVYLHQEDKDGEVHISQVLAKARVAPLKDLPTRRPWEHVKVRTPFGRC